MPTLYTLVESNVRLPGMGLKYMGKIFDEGQAGPQTGKQVAQRYGSGSASLLQRDLRYFTNNGKNMSTEPNHKFYSHVLSFYIW